MANNIRIIELKQNNESVVVGKMVYITHSHYYLKRLDKNSSLKIKKDRVKAMYTLDELYSMVADLDSDTFVELGKELKKKKASIGTSDAVYRVMVEIGALNLPVLTKPGP